MRRNLVTQPSESFLGSGGDVIAQNTVTTDVFLRISISVGRGGGELFGFLLNSCSCTYILYTRVEALSTKRKWEGEYQDFFLLSNQMVDYFFSHTVILEKLLTQENRVLEYWTSKKKRLDQNQQFCLFERSARQSLAWIKEEGDIYLSTHTRVGTNREETERLLKEHNSFKVRQK